jgi:hypothetical protein
LGATVLFLSPFMIHFPGILVVATRPEPSQGGCYCHSDTSVARASLEETVAKVRLRPAADRSWAFL